MILSKTHSVMLSTGIRVEGGCHKWYSHGVAFLTPPLSQEFDWAKVRTFNNSARLMWENAWGYCEHEPDTTSSSQISLDLEEGG
jgi:hypothetical protein